MSTKTDKSRDFTAARRKSEVSSAETPRVKTLNRSKLYRTEKARQVTEDQSLVVRSRKRAPREHADAPSKGTDPVSAISPTMKTADSDVPLSKTTSTRDLGPDTKAPEAPDTIPPPEELPSPISPSEDRILSRLLALPTELRLRIYTYVLQPNLPVTLLLSSSQVHLWGQGIPTDLMACAQVNKSLHAEIQDIIFERLTFRLRPENGKGLPSTKLIGQVRTCGLFKQMRNIEIGFPINAMRSWDLGGEEETVGGRLKVLCAALEEIEGLRKVDVDCDATAFIGDHDDLGVEFFAMVIGECLGKLKKKGVRIRFVNVGLGKGGKICGVAFNKNGWNV